MQEYVRCIRSQEGRSPTRESRNVLLKFEGESHESLYPGSSDKFASRGLFKFVRKNIDEV